MQEINEAAILKAANCPVCFKPPVMLVDDAVYPTIHKTKDFIIRCQMGHPGTATGDNPSMAVEHWNRYITFRQSDFHHNADKNDPRTMQLSYCPHCHNFTQSKLTMHDRKSTAECEGCHLIKSIKEIA